MKEGRFQMIAYLAAAAEHNMSLGCYRPILGYATNVEKCAELVYVPGEFES